MDDEASRERWENESCVGRSKFGRRGPDTPLLREVSVRAPTKFAIVVTCDSCGLNASRPRQAGGRHNTSFAFRFHHSLALTSVDLASQPAMADALIASIRSNLRGASTNDTRHTLQTEALQLRDYGHEAGLSTIQLNAVVRLALIAASADKVASRANKVALRLMGACTPKKGARLKHSTVLRIMGCLGNSPPLAEGIEEKDERKHKVDVKVQVS